ncbi:MAG: sigma 54-interacting transcriptional regulator [Polyangiaceae bacterium]
MADPRTSDHRPPEGSADRVGRTAWIVAFPRAMALPLPPPNEPFGRAFFEAVGLADSEISGRHAKLLRPRGGGVFLADAGSRNGTWIDGARLAPGEEVRLTDGAVLRLGRTLLVHREKLRGPLTPSPPLGALVAPYGVREVESALTAFRARPPSNVLVIGETGTGKELLAAAISNALGRGAPVAINVAALPATTFEAQLFGHTRGAFSDAKVAAPGIIGAADGGAVFLDEIGELPLELQPKLLRLLENREIQPVGAERPRRVDVLLVAATNQPLDELVARGAFRRDLHARLAAAMVQLPPLRERREDVFAIAQALASAAGDPLDPAACEVEAIEHLLLQPWPSNVRELAATLARVRRVDSSLGLRLWSLGEELPRDSREVPSSGSLTRERADQALAAAGGNESEAARILGVSRGALRRFLAKQRA